MRRRLTRVWMPVLLLGALPLLIGCKDAPAVSTLRWELERQIPGAEFEREFHIQLGRVSLGMVKGLAGWALEDEEGRSALKHVKRVDVGTYRVVSLPPIEEIQMPRGVESKLDGTGWSLMVRAQDEGERVWVFTRQDDGGGIRNIYVVALDEIELTMVSLEGRLDQVLADMVADDPSGFVAGLGS